MRSPDISGLVRAIGFRDPTKRLSVVTSIGSDAWDRLFSGPRPAELHPFVELAGRPPPRPATPGDLLFHIRAESMDVCFELAAKLVEAMAVPSPSSTRCTASGSSTTAT